MTSTSTSTLFIQFQFTITRQLSPAYRESLIEAGEEIHKFKERKGKKTILQAVPDVTIPALKINQGTDNFWFNAIKTLK